MKIHELFMINLGAQIFTNPQKTVASLTRPRWVGVNTGGKQPVIQLTEKVSFEIYSISIPESLKWKKHFQAGDISSQCFN